MTTTPTTAPTAAPEINRHSTTPEVLAWLAAHRLGSHAELVGRWVWLTFEAKPDADIRDAIKAAGFRWVKQRGRWAHSCGIPCRRSPHDPRAVYGAVPLDSLDS